MDVSISRVEGGGLHAGQSRGSSPSGAGTDKADQATGPIAAPSTCLILAVPSWEISGAKGLRGRARGDDFSLVQIDFEAALSEPQNRGGEEASRSWGCPSEEKCGEIHIA